LLKTQRSVRIIYIEGLQAVNMIKRKGLFVILIVIITLLLTWLAVNNSKQEVEIGNEEEGKMKERIDKVQRFDPNQSLNKGGENGLVFSLVEAADSKNAKKQFKYTVKNKGTRNQNLSFTTSQRYDYELSSKEHGLIERYSEGKNFLQVLGDIRLAPGDEVSYNISLPSLEKGNYILRIYLVASGINGSNKTLLFTVE
jgi:hypothetical protein